MMTATGLTSNGPQTQPMPLWVGNSYASGKMGTPLSDVLLTALLALQVPGKTEYRIVAV